MAVISDLNGAYGSTEYAPAVRGAVAKIVERAPDLVVCTGDMVAGERAGLDYRSMWAAFHREVTEPLAAAGIPLAVSPGNHDASAYPSFAHEREIFVEQWTRRRPSLSFTDGAHFPRWYAFSMGDALFVSLDATVTGPLDAEQRTWLDAQLVAAAELPVKIVFAHLPIQPLTRGREREVLADAALERMLVERGVTLFVSGHHHGYYPGRHGGLRQVGMPALGPGSRRLLGSLAPSAPAFVWIEIEDGELRTIDAYPAPDFSSPIRRESLPEHVGVLARDDLEPRP